MRLRVSYCMKVFKSTCTIQGSILNSPFDPLRCTLNSTYIVRCGLGTSQKMGGGKGLGLAVISLILLAAARASGSLMEDDGYISCQDVPANCTEMYAKAADRRFATRALRRQRMGAAAHCAAATRERRAGGAHPAAALSRGHELASEISPRVAVMSILHDSPRVARDARPHLIH